MTDLSQLSESQRRIYGMLVAGKTPKRISTQLDTTLGVVNAQITRMRTKGIVLPGAGYEAGPATIASAPTEVLAPPSGRPPATGSSSNEQIAEALQNQGKAIDADELRRLADRVAGDSARDIHPMILMGTAIQFMKLCGGRMSAHQVLEDVYGAMRMMVGGAMPEDGTAEPLPQTATERLQFLEEQNKVLRQRITELERR